ncbi:MAG: hypothetical protein WCH39_08120, partial [Schlesneria sp.]
EATAIDADARMNPRQLWLHDGSASAIESMLRGCRDAHREIFGNEDGLAVGLQLTPFRQVLLPPTSNRDA